MKLFNRGEESKEAPAVPAAPPAAPAPEAAPPPAAPEPDPLAVALDASVKEIAEKLARLSSSVENVREERTQFDEKFGKMEERMRKLTALAEMISTQYNPFLGSEPPASGSAVAAVQPVVAAQLAAEVRPHAPAPRSAAPAAPPAHAPAPAPPPPAPAPEPEWARPAPVPEDAAPSGPFLTRVDPSFHTSMTLLQWSEMLLRAAGRDGLPDLLDYYSALGWIGPDMKALVITYAKGLQVESDGRGDWRGRLDLHEKSLVFVEKLRPRKP